MKIISSGSIIILAILYNYYIHPQGDFHRHYTELYRIIQNYTGTSENIEKKTTPANSFTRHQLAERVLT